MVTEKVASQIVQVTKGGIPQSKLHLFRNSESSPQRTFLPDSSHQQASARMMHDCWEKGFDHAEECRSIHFSFDKHRVNGLPRRLRNIWVSGQENHGQLRKQGTEIACNVLSLSNKLTL